MMLLLFIANLFSIFLSVCTVHYNMYIVHICIFRFEIICLVGSRTVPHTEDYRPGQTSYQGTYICTGLHQIMRRYILTIVYVRNENKLGGSLLLQYTKLTHQGTIILAFRFVAQHQQFTYAVRLLYR